MLEIVEKEYMENSQDAHNYHINLEIQQKKSSEIFHLI